MNYENGMLIPTGSKVILVHHDGSRLVTRKEPNGTFWSGHLPPVDDDWINGYGWHIESFEPPLTPLPTAVGSAVKWSSPGRDHLGWLANDGTWDTILSRGEYVKGAKDPVQAILDHGYERPTQFTEYVPKEG